MKALLLRLEAPLQAWGTQSRFSERDTQLEPSKSGVIGILAAALGRRRHEPVDDLADLAMAVRVDREGRKMCDFHTVGGGNLPPTILSRYGVKQYGVSRANDNGTEGALSRRYYLADACFLVAVGGSDESILARLAAALASPVFPLFLGRKSFVPAAPLLHDPANPLRMGDSLEAILEAEPWQPRDHDRRRYRDPGSRLRLVVETAGEPLGTEGTEVVSRRLDHPVSFVKADRRFAERHVRTTFTAVPVERWRQSQQPSPEVSP
jgi:CRISPR system Cascade subunit CasD